MINYTQIRDAIITQLNAFMAPVQVIMSEQKEDKPPYPFIGYKVTSPYNEQAIGLPIETYENDPNIPQNTLYTRTEFPTMTISITAYSETIDEAEVNALKALSWFKYIGYQYLKDNGIVVVDTTSVQSRDTLIVSDYERRKGFDVILRVQSQVQRTIESIESVDYESGHFYL